jgi:hypothetical protein
MSPFMAIIVLAVLFGVVVFVVGVVMRKRKVILIGAPAALLLVVWFFLASSRPNPQKEFDRLFGAGNRGLASDIQTIKPTFMDGHFISFRMRPSDFDARVRSQFSEVGLGSPSSILLGQPLPAGWPSVIETTTSALHREVDYHDVYLLYFPSQEMAYASVRYDQW